MRLLYDLALRCGEVVSLDVEDVDIAQANGIGLEEVLVFSRHSRQSIAVLMIYRDRERNVQGKLAPLVAATAHAPGAFAHRELY
ncbi:MAG: hypothetical protein ACLQVY_25690 [Limisphaerales bacterium]